jgi:hypothetical protein
MLYLTVYNLLSFFEDAFRDMFAARSFILPPTSWRSIRDKDFIRDHCGLAINVSLQAIDIACKLPSKSFSSFREGILSLPNTFGRAES